MIEKIGVIYQDANSLGLLKGLQKRLDCPAEIVAPPAAIGKSKTMTSRQARLAWALFKKKGVDLVVRFTDADRSRWQDVRRWEKSVFPNAAESLFVCGVAVRNTEDWLALAPSYLAKALGIPVNELKDDAQRTDKIKAGLARIRRPEEKASDVVARLVADAPPEIFRTWLRDDALQQFYDDCRAAALRVDCDVPNEQEWST